MARRTQASTDAETGAKAQAAENKPSAGSRKPDSAKAEQQSRELLAALEAAEPKDAEQPKPVKSPAKRNGGNGKKDEAKTDASKDEQQKRDPIKLATAEGKVADGETVTVGVMRLANTPDGETMRKRVTVPKSWKIVQPAVRARMCHVVDEADTSVTLCTLSTNWQGGMTELPADSYISCGPCRVRMLAIKKTTEAKQNAAKQRAEKEKERRVAEAAKAKQDKADAKKADAKPEEPKKNGNGQQAKPQAASKPRQRGNRNRKRQAAA